MSLEGQDAVSGRRFSQDLRRIRELKGVTVAQLREETRVPQDLIEQFEASGLIDHPMFNQVYLRSFVRSYAQALGLPEAEVNEALEALANGRYRGQLAVRYLGEAPDVVPDPPAEPATEAAPVRPLKPSPPPAGKPGRKGRSSGAASPEVASGDKPKRTVHLAPPSLVSPSEKAPQGRLHEHHSPWESYGTRLRRGGRGRLRYALWTGVVLLVLGSVATLWWMQRAPEAAPSRTLAEPVPVEATPNGGETPEATAVSPSPSVALGDSMVVQIVAARRRLEPIRVKVDADARRPWWIEQDSSKTFVVRDSIRLGGPGKMLSRARVLINGHEVPLTPADTLLFITRETAARLLAR
jgi:hypothetical protein